MQKPKLKLTDDGSHTFYVPELDECYHSTKGAIQESNHIFIEAGLMASKKQNVNILEIGFGTGLNVLLTLACLNSSKHLHQTDIHYTAIELYPIPIGQVLELNYPERIAEPSAQVSRSLFEHIHTCPWDCRIPITAHFTLTKLKADFTRIDLDTAFDVIYFDAFSPEKQPEMWSESMFRKLYRHAAEDAILTTYSAKGAVRRAMQAAGFSVERLPGPPGKREMLRAIKQLA